MTTTDNRKKNFESPVARLVLLVFLFIFSGFTWLNYSQQGSGEQTNPNIDPLSFTTYQSAQTGLYKDSHEALPVIDKVPEQVGDPDQKLTKLPSGTKEVVETDTEKSKDNERLAMPNWEKIFNPDGTFKDEVNNFGARSQNGIADYVDLYNGTRADFIQDNISNGVATDMSALLSAVRISDEILYNGEVNPAHDLGNSYFLANSSPDGHKRIFLGIERLFAPVDSYIEVEFNQGPVQLGSGTNWWKIMGDRTFGDLLVRMNISGGMLSFVEFEQWDGNAYTILETYNGSPGNGCIRQEAFIFCGGPPPIVHPTQGNELWDANFNQVQPTLPDDFIQLGIDLVRLTGVNLEFSGVLIRTPEDIAINGFYVPRQLAYLGAPWLPDK